LLINKTFKIKNIISRLLPAFLFLTVGCSLFTKDSDQISLELKDYSPLLERDYADHLSNFEALFLDTSSVSELSLSRVDEKYLLSLGQRIIKNNAIFFKQKESVSIYLIKDETPYHFSLPGKKVFLSTGLFKKYVQNESLLMCVLTFELIRSEKNIYKKLVTIPTGNLGAKEILPLLRLSATQKSQIHKWAFRLLKKLSIDSDTYLSWLQIQNRNSIDFSMQLGDINVISREEALFKAFIIENSRGERQRDYKRSSKSFYKFLRSVRNNS